MCPHPFFTHFICADCTSLLRECKSFHIFKNQAPRWTSICSSSYFLCTISCCLLHFRSAALALCGSFPLSSHLYSNFSWPCTIMTESTVDAVKHFYITFLVSDTGSRTDANSRAASKGRIYSLQAMNSHASAPPSEQRCSERSSEPVRTVFAVSLVLAALLWAHLPLLDVSSKRLIKLHSG